MKSKVCLLKVSPECAIWSKFISRIQKSYNRNFKNFRYLYVNWMQVINREIVFISIVIIHFILIISHSNSLTVIWITFMPFIQLN